MVHPFFASQRALVFAHRGGSALAPENTLAAFDRGLALGADGLELDVHLSKDGVVVVHHDRRLERTTNLMGAIADYTAAELARADGGYFFRRVQDPPCSGRPGLAGTDIENDHRSEFPFRGQGCGIPTLAEVFSRYRDARIVVELKLNTAELAERVVGLVRHARAVDRVCLGSFGSRVLAVVRRLEPAIATSASREEVRWAVYRSWCRWPAVRVQYQGYQVPEWAGRTHVVSRRFIERAHAARLGVQVWTVNDEATAERLLQWGVDALITDRPDLIVPLVQRRAALT